jgi:hypothetical protein
MVNVNGLLSSKGQKIVKDFLELLNVDGDITNMSLSLSTDFNFDWNATVFARLGLLDLMDEKFMWLDSDTILRSGWTEIFAEAEGLMQDSNIVACAVLDCATTLEDLRSSGKNAAFLASQGAYFNSGIVLADPIRWRHFGMDLRWRDLVARQLELGFVYPDQDILNYVLAGKVGLLPARFNHIVSEASRDAEAILHFAGAPKPWRLTERGKAFFVATEAVNFDRPDDQISVGETWRLFPIYWSAERGLIDLLHEKGDSRLINSLLALREEQMIQTPVLERLKFMILRLLSRKILPHHKKWNMENA